MPEFPRQLKSAGFDFVVRYVGTPGRRKNITAAEFRDMTGAGVGVALVFENRAGNALAGRAAGARNARAALEGARSFGWPHDRPIYMAVDQDITTESQMRTVVEYLRGAGDVLGIERIGVYGEADVVDRAQREGVARWFWQTKAWSRKRISPHASSRAADRGRAGRRRRVRRQHHRPSRHRPTLPTPGERLAARRT
ncbi:glycoside hydrolase domain-containing protein [Saccharopolyspora sp. NPDC002376]